MANIRLPPMLTIEEEDEYPPGDKYHLEEPIKKHIIVSFGDTEVVRYTLEAGHWPGHFYYDGDNNNRILYDDPAEFLAHKLKKLFALIG